MPQLYNPLMPPEVERIIETIKKHPKTVAIYIFGSFARGEEKPLSDVDVAVILKEPDKWDEADIGSLYSRKVDVVLFHRLPVYIQYEVLKYGKEVYVADEEFLGEIRFKVIKNYLEHARLYRFLEREILR